ncbi:hypothetical protein fugu_001852 [Takifugu bimaculatus]|uniref:CHORD domain-containing protein n=1 Tax=Takifugu bimaculatus TaxID=433685 RepID=A0A4Z2BQ19_9TELE|nr:hypothetical protein fugu_001852 [Takifugu bimaculatus]
MALLCYNKGCGQKFDEDKNKDDSCLFHPGVPIFHDALKGWSCCRKRTTDFSEFLSIKGCTRGRHSNEKPQEPLRPEVSSEKAEAKHANGEEIIYQGPKSAEALQRDRPSRTVLPGTRCKNTGCKTVYEGPDTDMEVCKHHPGGPVFHEGYKFWSCCCIKTTDFNAFLDQKGCSSGRHCWVTKKDKKKVACRHDWHQTGNSVVLTIYAKNANADLCCVEANRTVLSCQIQFEDNKIFKRNFHLWGVVNVPESTVNMVPSKVEIVLRKAHQVAWGKLEDPNHKAEPEQEDPLEDTAGASQSYWDIADDDISDSDEEWAYDTPGEQEAEGEEQQGRRGDAGPPDEGRGGGDEEGRRRRGRGRRRRGRGEGRRRRDTKTCRLWNERLVSAVVF